MRTSETARSGSGITRLIDVFPDMWPSASASFPEEVQAGWQRSECINLCHPAHRTALSDACIRKHCFVLYRAPPSRRLPPCSAAASASLYPKKAPALASKSFPYATSISCCAKRSRAGFSARRPAACTLRARRCKPIPRVSILRARLPTLAGCVLRPRQSCWNVTVRMLRNFQHLQLVDPASRMHSPVHANSTGCINRKLSRNT